MKPPKRPRDANQLARRVVDLATGEREDEKLEPPTPAQELGQRGGVARSRKLTTKQKHEIARLAAEARWKKS